MLPWHQLRRLLSGGWGSAYTFDVTTPGSGYAPGDTIVIKGSDLGGVDVANDCTLTVKNVDSYGSLSAASLTVAGIPPEYGECTQVYAYECQKAIPRVF